MSRKDTITRSTADEVKRRLKGGGDKTDWKRVKAMSQSEVERLADEEEGALAQGWEDTVVLGLPPLKKNIHIRLDADILEWFKAHGAGYQTRINAVLRAYVAAQANRQRNNHTS
jgi:uncharacterized protein (DUF4415 family)